MENENQKVNFTVEEAWKLIKSEALYKMKEHEESANFFSSIGLTPQEEEALLEKIVRTISRRFVSDTKSQFLLYALEQSTSLLECMALLFIVGEESERVHNFMESTIAKERDE